MTTRTNLTNALEAAKTRKTTAAAILAAVLSAGNAEDSPPANRQRSEVTRAEKDITNAQAKLDAFNGTFDRRAIFEHVLDTEVKKGTDPTEAWKAACRASLDDKAIADFKAGPPKETKPAETKSEGTKAPAGIPEGGRPAPGQ